VDVFTGRQIGRRFAQRLEFDSFDKGLAMLELITASPGLLAGLGLYIATAAVILTSRSPEADDEKTP